MSGSTTPPLPEATTADQPAGLTRLAVYLDGASSARFLLVVIAPVLVVYLATASWRAPDSPDTYLNGLTAYQMAKHHTAYLDDRVNDTKVDAGKWIVPTRDGHLISLYPPGAALHAAPLSILAGGTHQVTVVSTEAFSRDHDLPRRPVVLDLVPTWPAALTAVLTTTAAMAIIALTLRRLSSGSVAAAATAVAAFATSAWSVGADELWQHSPAMAWIAASGYLLSRRREAAGGLAAGIAIVCRPITMLIGLGSVAIDGWNRRWRSVIPQVAGLSIGLAFLTWFNIHYLGSASPLGGYAVTKAGAAHLPNRTPLWVLANQAKGLFAPRYGLLVWSPWLIPLVWGLRKAWRDAPDWVRGTALGGLVYIVTSWTLDVASGGAAYYFYRYPLEPLVAAGPLLFLAYGAGVGPVPARRRWFWRLVGLSALAHALAAITM